jgi:hypothetical protein
MRRLWAILGLLCGLAAGCLTGEPAAAPDRWLERLSPFQGKAAFDVVVMDVALVQVPVGDRYLNQDLWAAADEQIIPAERRGSMEDNGLRIGLAGAIPPEGLLNLIVSPRNCPEPRRIQTHTGNSTTVPLGSTFAELNFLLHDDAHPTGQPVSLADADIGLMVTPTLTPEGRVHLQFVPQVEHGKTALQPGPAADRSGWELQQQRPCERYPFLAWETTISPGEYLVVGACYDRRGTLGHRAFIRTEPVPVQRILVLRASPLKPEPMAGAIADDPSFRKAPPLACQAQFTAARATRD